MSSTFAAIRRLRPQPRQALIAVLAIALAATMTWHRADAAPAKNPQAPRSAALENALGIRFTQATLVGDNGLVELRYVVLDGEKASRFQANTKNPPRLRNEKRGGLAWRTALMKQGHSLRPGQTYYLLYQNTKDVLRRGDTLEIQYGANKLAHVPVQ